MGWAGYACEVLRTCTRIQGTGVQALNTGGLGVQNRGNRGKIVLTRVVGAVSALSLGRRRAKVPGGAAGGQAAKGLLLWEVDGHRERGPAAALERRSAAMRPEAMPAGRREDGDGLYPALELLFPGFVHMSVPPKGHREAPSQDGGGRDGISLGGEGGGGGGGDLVGKGCRRSDPVGGGRELVVEQKLRVVPLCVHGPTNRLHGTTQLGQQRAQPSLRSGGGEGACGWRWWCRMVLSC